jgi:hypothetical protein
LIVIVVVVCQICPGLDFLWCVVSFTADKRGIGSRSRGEKVVPRLLANIKMIRIVVAIT